MGKHKERKERKELKSHANPREPTQPDESSACNEYSQPTGSSQPFLMPSEEYESFEDMKLPSIYPVVRAIPLIKYPQRQQNVAQEYVDNLTTVTEVNEKIVRSIHPALKGSTVVFACQWVTSTWVIPDFGDARLHAGTEAVGRTIQLLDRFQTPHLPRSTGFFNGAALSNIEANKLLSIEQGRSICKFFPGAVTATALRTRHVRVVFCDKSAIQACWAARLVQKVGVQFWPSPDDVSYEFASMADASHLDEDRRAVRLEFPGGSSIIIVVPQSLMIPEGWRGRFCGWLQTLGSWTGMASSPQCPLFGSELPEGEEEYFEMGDIAELLESEGREAGSVCE
ncbi:hypothetical protein FQN52_005472 [Onygenales sp. PD_12]|nr:hypothetical protein FQN52_005472 [Onygenales sp. PD_12]KAK2795990.1 hypothetical protein FQN51_009535 [Onygenales sp. PD_10]